MNVLIDGQTLLTPEITRGIGVYFRNVLNNMVKGSYSHNWYIALANTLALKHLDPWVAERLIPVKDDAFLPTADPAQAERYTVALENAVYQYRIDCFWTPNPLMVNVLFPVRELPCRMFITIHDVIPLVMPVKGWPDEVRKEYDRRIGLINGSSMTLLCVSEATASDCRRLMGQVKTDDARQKGRKGRRSDNPESTGNPEITGTETGHMLKIGVTHEAADERIFYAQNIDTHHRTGDYNIVYTGGFDERKNIYGALEAFVRLCAKYSQAGLAHLTIVCRATKEEEEKFYSKVEELERTYAKQLPKTGPGIRERVRLTGFVTDEELARLYQTCDVFFFPSLYEGFGLPILEAMLGGAYVLSADNSSLPEICGGHAMLCNAEDIDDMADKLYQALCASAAESAVDRKARQDYALTYSWEKTAARTLGYMENNLVYDAYHSEPGDRAAADGSIAATDRHIAADGSIAATDRHMAADGNITSADRHKAADGHIAASDDSKASDINYTEKTDEVCHADGSSDRRLPAQRIKLAIATPWPDMKTGIGNYMYMIVPYMTKYFEIDLFVDRSSPGYKNLLPVPEGCGMYPLTELSKRHGDYDTILYEIGNNKDFHAGIYKALAKYGGITELHDYILQFFFYYAYYLKGDKETFRQALINGYGDEGAAYYDRVDGGLSDLDMEMDRFPMSDSVAAISDAVIVHNHWSEHRIGTGNTYLVPHPSFPNKTKPTGEVLDRLRERIHFNGGLIIGCFGYINDNKRPYILLDALSRILEEKSDVKLVFWGGSDSDRIELVIQDQKLTEHAVITGYLSTEEYEAALEMTDIVVNLRYPTVGESSGTLSEALYNCKPVIVSDTGQYREYPDEVCWKVPVGRGEVQTLVRMLEKLMESPELRQAMGDNAGAYAREVLSPERIAANYYDIVKNVLESRSLQSGAQGVSASGAQSISSSGQHTDPSASRKPIALIIPWYGDRIRGGAENECNFLAHCLTKAGQQVEVFTTCTKEAASDRGRNTMRPGVYKESGITVRRFAVRENKVRDMENYITSNNRIYRDAGFTEHDEEVYFREDINSETLNAYIRDHRDDYRVFIFIPYMYGVTWNGAGIWPEKSIMIPCLHEESYAHMKLVKKRLESLRGLAFNAKPEYELASQLYDLRNVHTAVLGLGLETDWRHDCRPERFRKKYRIKEPFILYAGRKDAGKKTDELIEFYLHYRDTHPASDLKLVLMGGGSLPVEIPKKYQKDVIDTGFVSPKVKYDAYAACSIFCNPSRTESFSLVIMEAWLMNRPVLVSEYCPVTKNFALESGGGFAYHDREEFMAYIDRILEHPDEAAAMGGKGCQYVLDHFTGERIAENYLRFIGECGL